MEIPTRILEQAKIATIKNIQNSDLQPIFNRLINIVITITPDQAKKVGDMLFE